MGETATKQRETPSGAPAGAAEFDVAGFVAAMRSRDAGSWADFFAADAEWLSYRHSKPARDPQLRIGNLTIHDYLKDVCASDAHLHVEDLVTSDDSVWFRRMVRLGDGRMLIEHVHLRHSDGRITREIDVESWDFPEQRSASEPTV